MIVDAARAHRPTVAVLHSRPRCAFCYAFRVDELAAANAIGGRTAVAGRLLRASYERHAGHVGTQLRLQKVVGPVVVLFGVFVFAVAAVPRAVAAR